MLGCGNGVSLSIVTGERALRGCATHLAAKSRYKLSGISMNPDRLDLHDCAKQHCHSVSCVLRI